MVVDRINLALEMGWTPQCQKRRYHMHSSREWVEWINGLPEEGFGRYTKKGWQDWYDRMATQYGDIPDKTPAIEDAKTPAIEDASSGSRAESSNKSKKRQKVTFAHA